MNVTAKHIAFPYWYRIVSVGLLVVIFSEFLTVPIAHAITSGPVQPEFTSFEPLGTTGMVNEFTGGFTYNVPLLEVPGPHGSSYPVTMSYHSGASAEDDASWVGFGWTLNVGAINRSVRGLPDDFRNQKITQLNHTPANEVFSAGLYGAFQFASNDAAQGDVRVQYDNYKGFSTMANAEFSFQEYGSVRLTNRNGINRLTVNPNWANIFAAAVSSGIVNELWSLLGTGVPNEGANAASAIFNSFGNVSIGPVNVSFQSSVSNYLFQSFETRAMPVSISSMYGSDLIGQFGVTLGVTPGPILAGGHAGVVADYHKRAPVREFEVNTYGYLYDGEANAEEDLADFSVERDARWTSRDRYLYPTFQTYDIFNCNAQGVGGGVKLVHASPGYCQTPDVTNTFVRGAVSLEFGGLPDKLTVGGSISIGLQHLIQGRGIRDGHPWRGLRHKSYGDADHNTRALMRFNNDPADNVSFSNSVDPESPNIVFGFGTGLELWCFSDDHPFYERANNNGSSLDRAASSSHVTYRINKEMVVGATGSNAHPSAYSLGLSDTLLSRHEDPSIADGIGEISVTNRDGVRNVFGLPVYARNERNLQHVGEKLNKAYRTGNHTVYGTFNSSTNTAIGEKRLSPYASMFLLTCTTTPDYVDRTMDGPTQDDFGGYTSFAYRRTAGTYKKGDFTDSSSKLWYKWRTPYEGYRYSPGRISVPNDDRGAVSMGEKELYYLSRIDTKTHTAFFITNKTSINVVDENGDTIHLEGSMQERYDAYEAYNSGDLERDESACGNLPGTNVLTSFDGQELGEYEGKYIGGTKKGRKLLDDGFKAYNTRPNKSEYLEKIVLIAKNTEGEFTDVVKSVNLEYNYELFETPPGRYVQTHTWNERFNEPQLMEVRDWDTTYPVSGTLNSAITPSSVGVYEHHSSSASMYRYGKLTLKRVWSDYGSALRSHISPYEFQYTYPRTGTQDYANEVQNDDFYSDIVEFDQSFNRTDEYDSVKADSLTAGVQNRSYGVEEIDAWGMQRWDGASDDAMFRKHYSQKPQDGAAGHDAGAWQLKVIRLPSGGEIHVQYESNTYSWVQDQPAMALVPVRNAEVDGDVWSYDLDLRSLPGRDPATIAQLIRDYAHDEKLFYKFLCPVTRCSPDPKIELAKPDTLTEYITGYMDIDPAAVTVIDDSTVRVVMQSDITPADQLYEFIRNERMFVEKCPQYMDTGRLEPILGFNEKALTRLYNLGAEIVDAALNLASFVHNPTQFDVYNNLSYLRIPCQYKYGGGVRVKRLFLYDEGIEPGRAAIYGSEYEYDSLSAGVKFSCGVATNEPSSIREECSLIKFLPFRDEQNFFQRLAAGQDLEQFEGPLAESMLPGPSVGYSRVIVKNLVSTATTPGFTVSEFYTARDHPFKVDWTTLESMPEYFPNINILVLNISKGGTTLAQGYSVVTNAMHGQPKGVKKCSGVPTSSDPQSWHEVESIEYQYFNPGEAIPVLQVSNEGEASITSEVRGMDMDVHIRSQSVHDLSEQAKVSGDVGVMLPFFVMGHVSLPMVSVKDSYIKSATFTKVISYAAFQKATIIKRDSKITVVENVAFDRVSGSPLITRTYDEFHGLNSEDGILDGALVDYTIPAHAKNAAMGPRSKNEMLFWHNATVAISDETVIVTTNESFASRCMPGDILKLEHSSGTGFAQVMSIDGADLVCAFAAKTPAPPETSGVEVTVVKSGRTNQLNAVSGKILRSGYSDVGTTDVWNFDSGIIRASATTFGDEWAYDDVLQPDLFDEVQINDFAKGQRGKWRPVSQYVYQDSTLPLSTTHRAWKAGRAANGFTPFPYDSVSTRDTNRWIRMSTVTQYTANGDVAEETNAMNLLATASFSHSGSVPSIIARNASYGIALFESFEDRPASGSITLSPRHTGIKSLVIPASTEVTACTLRVNQQAKNAGMLIRAWVHTSTATAQVSAKIGSTSISTGTEKAYVNGWRLMQWDVAKNHASLSTEGAFVVKFSFSAGSGNVDDVRIQPAESEATCYVYDPATLRLVAQFDDRHFAAIYKYNDEGRLTRNERETERGVFPLQEAHYNTPAIAYATRNTDFVGTAPVMRRLEDMIDQVGGPQVHMPRTANGPGVSMQSDLLDIQVSPTRRRIMLFGSDSVTLSHPDSLVNRLKKINVPLNTNDSTQRGKQRD